ncbi:MAG: transcriptional regulator, AsnC family [Candidatus Eremiobacteraeota bacterium]|nr:transcriptional regulator, AsnC family [Candidatus Eremiobacteraeota bacterium]
MNPTKPVWIDDPTNAAILAVSEDRLSGFQLDPFGTIAERSGLDVATVLERIVAMLGSGTIRRVRQTLMATNLAKGSLCAWQVPAEKLDAAFDWLFREDPFSGHVVIRSTDSATAGSNYRLWTTLKVPQGYEIAKYAAFLAGRIGAEAHRLMPAEMLFALGVGHVRRQGLEPGARAAEPAVVKDTNIVELSELEWRVLTAIKREFAPSELVRDLWRGRASEAGVSLEEFARVGTDLNRRGVIGRFSTFLEHVKPNAAAGGAQVTRYNALFHWKVPVGREVDAGREVGRHYIMTHAYWREGGPEFKGVNIMGVAHGTDKAMVLAHKAAIDDHLREAGIAFDYTNVFWGGRSEIKPSEIAPAAFADFCSRNGIDPETMR